MSIPFVFRRLMMSLALLMAMSAATFWLLHKTPGSFFDSLKLNPQMSPEIIAYYENTYHLKDPWWMQYGAWLVNVLQGKLGYSFYYNIPVEQLIGPRLFNTFLLSLASLVLTWGLGVPLGIWAALTHRRWPDKFLTLFSFTLFSFPGFFMAMLLLALFSPWGILPLGGMHSAHFDTMPLGMKIVDVAKHLVIPSCVLSFITLASLQRIMRGRMLAELGQPYVRAARARGIREGGIVYRHVLPNAINPLITLLGYEFGALLSGAALVEIVTSWPGLGTLMLTAVRAKDVYVVMASMLMGGIMLLLGNFLADLLLRAVDPRIADERK